MQGENLINVVIVVFLLLKFAMRLTTKVQIQERNSTNVIICTTRVHIEEKYYNCNLTFHSCSHPGKKDYKCD